MDHRRGRSLKQLYGQVAALVVGLAVGNGLLLVLATKLIFGRYHPPFTVYFSGLNGDLYITLPACLVWVACWLVVESRRREIARVRADAEVREAALKARHARLRQQINPHFLFNALNALYTLIQLGRAEQARRMIAAVVRFVERIAPEAADVVPLRRELELQDAYLEIERVRFGERLRLRRDIEPEVEGALAPVLILQPLVENAVKYALARSAEPVEIAIAARREGQDLVLQVEDTGGDAEGPRPVGLGVGLRNVEGRLKSLYGAAGRLACRPLEPRGFLAEIRMPLSFAVAEARTAPAGS